MPQQRVLRVQHLNSFYRQDHAIVSKTGAKKQILKDVSFSLAAGEVLGLVGESGGGKSTLARAICGITKDCTGEIQCTSRPQMVFQDPFSSLNPAKTVGWILEEPLRVQKRLSHGERVRAVKQMLARVGLDEPFLQRRPWELSGGQRQRVAIAAAVIAKPELIIADEPVSALDVTTQAQILQLMMELKQELHLSYLFITHDFNVVWQVCDRVMVMQDGEIVEENTVTALFDAPQHPYTQRLLQDSL